MANKSKKRGRNFNSGEDEIYRKIRRRKAFKSGRLVAEIERRQWDVGDESDLIVTRLFELMVTELAEDNAKDVKKKQKKILNFTSDLPYPITSFDGAMINDPSAIKPGWRGSILLVHIDCKYEYSTGRNLTDDEKTSGSQLASVGIGNAMKKVASILSKRKDIKDVTTIATRSWLDGNGYLSVILEDNTEIFLVPTWEINSLTDVLERSSTRRKAMDDEDCLVEKLSIPLVVNRRLEEIYRNQPLLKLAFDALYRFVTLHWGTHLALSPHWWIYICGLTGYFASTMPSSKGAVDATEYAEVNGIGKELSRDALDLFFSTIHHLGSFYFYSNNDVELGKIKGEDEETDDEDSGEDGGIHKIWGQSKYLNCYFNYPTENEAIYNRFRVNISSLWRPETYELLYGFNIVSKLLNQGLSHGKLSLYDTLKNVFDTATIEPTVWDCAIDLSHVEEPLGNDLLSVIFDIIGIKSIEGTSFNKDNKVLKINFSSNGVRDIMESERFYVGPVVNTESAQRFRNLWIEKHESRLSDVKVHSSIRIALELFTEKDLAKFGTPSVVGSICRLLSLYFGDTNTNIVVPIWGNGSYLDRGIIAVSVPGCDIDATPWKEVHYWTLGQMYGANRDVYENAFSLLQRWLWQIGVIPSGFSDVGKQWKPAFMLWCRALLVSAAMGADGYGCEINDAALNEINRRIAQTGESIFYKVLNLLANFPFGFETDSCPFILPMIPESTVTKKDIEFRIHQATQIFKKGKNNGLEIVSVSRETPLFLPCPSPYLVKKMLKCSRRYIASVVPKLIGTTDQTDLFIGGQNPMLNRCFKISKIASLLSTTYLVRMKNVLRTDKRVEVEAGSLDYIANASMPQPTQLVDDEPNYMVIGSIHSLSSNLIPSNDSSSVIAGSIHACNSLGPNGLLWDSNKPTLRIGLESMWYGTNQWREKLNTNQIKDLIKLRYDVIGDLVENLYRIGGFAQGFEVQW